MRRHSPNPLSDYTEDKQSVSIRRRSDTLWLQFIFALLIGMSAAVIAIDMKVLTGYELQQFLPERFRPQPAAFAPPSERTTQADLPSSVQLMPKRSRTKPFDLHLKPGLTGNGAVAMPGISKEEAGVFVTKSMRFIAAEDGVASAVGSIKPGTLGVFEQFLKAEIRGEDGILVPRAPINTLYIHSIGGSVRDAIAMARALRERGIKTIVPDGGYCASSCPLLFSGGVERVIGKDAMFGVHQVYTDDSADGTLQEGMAGAQEITSQAQRLLADMGVSLEAWIYAMATPKERIYLFSRDEIDMLEWEASPAQAAGLAEDEARAG